MNEHDDSKPPKMQTDSDKDVDDLAAKLLLNEEEGAETSTEKRPLIDETEPGDAHSTFSEMVPEGGSNGSGLTLPEVCCGCLATDCAPVDVDFRRSEKARSPSSAVRVYVPKIWRLRVPLCEKCQQRLTKQTTKILICFVLLFSGIGLVVIGFVLKVLDMAPLGRSLTLIVLGLGLALALVAGVGYACISLVGFPYWVTRNNEVRFSNREYQLRFEHTNQSRGLFPTVY